MLSGCFAQLLVTAAIALTIGGGGGVTAFAEEGVEEELPRVPAERIEVAVEEEQGAQFLGADSKGRLVLMRGWPPQIYALDPSGSASAWGDAEDRQAAMDGLVHRVLEASLSPEGTWIVITPEQIVRIFRDEVQILPSLRWSALAVAQPDHVVAAVVPVIRGHMVPKYDPEAPPLLMEYTSSGWRTLTKEPFSAAEKRVEVSDQGTHRMFRALTLAPASAGGTWAANRYIYRLRRFSPSGREMQDLTLAPEATPEHFDEDVIEELRETLEAEAKLHGMEGAELHPFTAKEVLEAVVEGRDGKVYLYVAPGIFGGDPLLDRYDPLNHRLERAVLGIAKHPGRVSMASGKDGLWIAAKGSDHQLWRISWQVLQELKWSRVSGLYSDGLPVEPLADERP